MQCMCVGLQRLITLSSLEAMFSLLSSTCWITLATFRMYVVVLYVNVERFCFLARLSG